MGLGYMLLAVKSEQDKYLVGNPQFTFFKGAYKRHTHFALDQVFVPFVGETYNAYNKKLYVDIPKSGDLLHRMYLVLDIENNTSQTDISNVNLFGYSFIEYVDIIIDGQLIDRHYSDWLMLYLELMQDKRKELATGLMTGIHSSTDNKKTLFLPLRFWFNNDIGLSLPLIALQYSTVRIEVKLNDKSVPTTYVSNLTTTANSITNTNLSLNRMQMLCEYIHLDKDERVLFSSKQLEYMITQVQSSLNNPIQLYTSSMTNEKYEDLTHRFDLRFNHPVKSIFWGIKDNYVDLSSVNLSNNLYDNTTGILYYNYWRNANYLREQMKECNIVMNGKDVTEPLQPQYFRFVQDYQHHLNSSLLNVYNSNKTSNNAPNYKSNIYPVGMGFYNYNFAFNPSETQPSGSVNFSKLEQAQLKIKLYRDKDNFTYSTTTLTSNLTAKYINIYALSINVLRIMSGKAGLAFAT
jgi:hypothetical protein